MRTKGSAAELEARRRRAAKHFQERKPLAEIAQLVGASLSSVKRWKRAWQEGGIKALAAKPHPGPTPKLSSSQKQELVAILRQGPIAAGYRTDLWTCARDAKVVRKMFRVSYHPDHLGRILHDLGFSPQKPQQVAREQDPVAVAQWRKKDWPRQKKARRRNASIVFIDETGFRLQPVNRRTWAPRGETPIQRSWDRHDRLSVISAITVSSRRKRIGMPFQIHEDNIRTDQVVAFVKQLRPQLRKPLIIIWDRWPVHRAAVKRIQASRMKNIEFEWLPAYAPELNPVEPRWSHTKFRQMANYVPDDVRQLKRTVRTSLKRHAKDQTLSRSFFQSAH